MGTESNQGSSNRSQSTGLKELLDASSIILTADFKFDNLIQKPFTTLGWFEQLGT